MQQVEQLYNNPTQLRMMRLSKAQDFVPMMTTDQLKEVVAFYSDPVGEKLLANNVNIGKTLVDAFIKEILRASEEYKKAAIEDLRRKVKQSRNK